MEGHAMNGLVFFGDFDVAELSLVAFFGFFVYLVICLRREDRREGYPLANDVSGRREPMGGFLFFPAPKTFRLPHGHGEVTVPTFAGETRDLPHRRSAPMEGSPIEPVGDPLTAGIGPGAWVERADHPDLNMEGLPRIVPMRVVPDFHVARQSADPRGFPVLGADGRQGGVVTEVWLDRAESLVRYLEVDVGRPDGRGVLLPMNMAVVHGAKRTVGVYALLGHQLAGVPVTASPDQVTLLEEDKIVGFYGAGHLYATPDRQEPLI
jgi:photosynthetic reaction center H subunit